jgi:hypothetical protein
MRAQPARLNSAIAWLFVLGASCFALGTIPAYVDAVGAAADATTFFVGSIFFTTASLLQLKQTSRLDRLDWWACVVQSAGTLFFNVTTFTAMNDALSTKQEAIRVWAPDALGSACFLVASGLALAAV